MRQQVQFLPWPLPERQAMVLLPWPLPERQAMVLWPPCCNVTDNLTEQTRTDMSAKPATGVEE